MVQILSRVLALLFAVGLVGASGWALSRSYLIDLWPRWTTVECICFVPTYSAVDDWHWLRAGMFSLRAPDDATLHEETRYGGLVVDRRFTIAYDLNDRVNDDTFAMAEQAYSEEPVTIDGRDGVIRWATFPGRRAPLFLQLVLPRAVKRADGHWLALETHGWFRDFDQRWLAEKVLKTIVFKPAFDVAVTPDRPRVVPPVIEIDSSSVRDAP